MEFEVKLYYYHDLDLISIYRQGSLWFQKATVLALRAFCEQKYIRLKSSEPCRKLALRRMYRYRIYLTEAKDAEVIALLERIQPGHRNNFIKTVLRQYFCEFPVDYFKDPADKAFFDQCTASMHSMHDAELIACPMPKKASGDYRKKSSSSQERIQGTMKHQPETREQPAETGYHHAETGNRQTDAILVKGNGTEVLSAARNPPAAHMESSIHPQSASPVPEPYIQDTKGQSPEDELTMLFMVLTGG